MLPLPHCKRLPPKRPVLHLTGAKWGHGIKGCSQEGHFELGRVAGCPPPPPSSPIVLLHGNTSHIHRFGCPRLDSRFDPRVGP